MWQKLKKLWWDWRGVWIATPLVTALVAGVRLTPLPFSGDSDHNNLYVLEPWEWGAFDLYMRWRLQEKREDRIAIVAIDEKDIKRVGQPIFPHLVYVDVLSSLLPMKPIAIGLDIYRDLPVEPGHKKLVKIFKDNNNIIEIEKYIGNEITEKTSAPLALKAKGKVGINDVKIDADGTIH